jgi:transcriptional regulator with XRE-family HTH domain
MVNADDQLLSGIGAHLRSLRRAQSLTLADLATRTGVSQSALSRIETGNRYPTLAQLLPLCSLYGLDLDALVDPNEHTRRVHAPSFTSHGATYLRLGGRPGGIQSFKMIYKAPRVLPEPELCRHEGHLTLNVLAGRLRVALGDHEFVLSAGEVAAFDTSVPHGMGPVDHQQIEALLQFGPQGQQPRLVARTGDGS